MRMYFFILSLFFCGATYAQITISGSVTDANNQPVPGANVVLVGDTMATVTDSDGKFILSTSSQPPYVLEISSIGFGTTTVNVADPSQPVNAILADEETRLDEIIVSASRTPGRILESPYTVETSSIHQDSITTPHITHTDNETI